MTTAEVTFRRAGDRDPELLAGMYDGAAGRRAVGEEPGKLAADGTRYGVALMERVLPGEPVTRP
ncbi:MULTISPECIES: hypothetical protein [unclassified Streptomyces]|uniref:hypothetical protein n=1 Tax=unclassified Streptomyces TaxID=2593676 RepID=UPI0006ADD7D2|nr:MULTISPECIES: hypothetical protein [unclassified Streptomyces]KOX20180.1 hypothetical protein ADL06_27955 [Streptomyces sp. NRRL F-6491]KOX38453.1 hypothetical protein ADL08_27395 [Streptomyces sp. NRRL F-6492]